MPFIRLFSFILAAVVLFTAMPKPAMAETSIAVVDVRALMNDSKAAKSIQKQVSEKRDDFLEKLSTEEQKLREQEQSLAKAQNAENKEEFSKKLKEFEESKLKTRQAVQERKRQLDESLATATNELQREIFKVVEKIAADKNYELVITRQNVVVGAKELDITEDAMKELNKSLSSINLK